jgi:hypothetical protein
VKHAKTIASALLVAGTIIATLGGARMPHVDRLWVGAGLVVLLAGAALLRVAERGGSGSTQAGASREGALQALRALPAHVSAIESEAAGLPLSDLATKLGALQTDHFVPLSRRAPELARTFGGDLYARVFGPYACAERALARAWSAAADGHRPEVIASLRRAAAELDIALREVDAAPEK